MSIPYKYIVAIVAVFGLFIDLLDATIVNVAVPTLARDFQASTTTIEWVVTGYLLSLAVFIPVSGWAGDKFGTKKTFIFALIVFSIASLLCALAWNVESLIAFRFLQGVGGGMLTPVGTTMVFRAFPPEERSKAAGLMVIPTTVAPASGPVLGGFLVEYVGWEWIFLVNVPIGVAAIIISWRFLKEQKEPAPGQFDPAGFVLAASGLGAVLYGLAEAGPHGFDDPAVVFFLAAGAALLAAFVAVELRVKEPMIDIRLLGNRLFRACSTAQFVAMIGFSGSLFLLPIMLQAERGMSPFESGLTTFPLAIGVMFVAQPASKAYRVIGPSRMIAAGLVISSLTAWALAYTDLETSAWTLRGIMLARGVGFGLMLVPLQAATFATIAPADTGRASSLFSVSRMVGQSFGVAVIATVLTNRLAHHGAFLGAQAPQPIRENAVLAFRDGFIVAGALTLVGVVMALLIKDSDAASTMAGYKPAAGEEERQPVVVH